MTEPVPSSDNSGLALLCDQDAIVVRTIRDDLGVGGAHLVGRPFTRIVDEASLGKAHNFLVELRKQEVVFGWELNFAVAGTLQSFHVAGGRIADQFLIVAASNSRQMLSLYQELIRMGNEQATQIRASLESDVSEIRQVREQDAVLFNEISRLNNQLGVMQRELAKKNKKLEQLDQSKNQFLGMVAHDLRNPLNAIQGYAEFLRNSYDRLPEKERQEFLDIILSTSSFMTKLVDDLLDVAQIESGRLELALRPTDLLSLVQKNIKLNSILASAKTIQISLHHEPLPGVMADPNKIEQVLNNLISNALKFSHPGSHVSVSLSQPDDSHVLIAVTDQGQGIPADQIDHLFHPFTMTSIRSTAGEKSTGLGLAIVRRIVEGHGGTIRVESLVGTGTSFYVTLPIRPATTAGETSPHLDG